MAPIVLKVQSLSMKYPKSQKTTLANLSFEIGEGTAVGFIGRNGSGKSTTIKCLTGILPYNEGSITIGAFDLDKEPVKAKKLLAYNSDNHATYEDMSGREYINFIGNIYQDHDYQSKLHEYLDVFEMKDWIDQRIGTYSHGMKQKVCLMSALIHDPSLWILDEPFTGLDCIATHYLKGYLKKQKEKKKAILLTCHDLGIVEEICDRVLIIDDGVLIADILIKDLEAPLEKTFFSLIKIPEETDE